jgi:predicted Zn finger-like uncharacterized protein
MSETKQTRCPFCSSVFNITDEQLAARGGHVRCGGCLQVFRADQHIVTGEAVTPTPSAPTSTSAPIVARAPNVTTSTTTTESPAKPVKKRKNPDDESWAKNLLGDDLDDELQEDNPDIKAPTAKAIVEAPKSAPIAAKKPLFDDEISDMLHDSWLEPTANKDHLKGVGEVDKIKASADESWAQALMSELEADEKKEQAKNHSMDLVPTKAKEPSRKSTSVDSRAEAPSQKASAKSNKTEKSDGVKHSKEDDLLSFLNSNSAPTINQRQANLPLEIKHAPMISIRWSYWITWTMLCCFALVLLMMQYIYFNFDSLSLNDKTRPQILQLCATLNCQVPEPPNIELIVINKLTVRNHPDTRGALRVNAIVYNKASFAQPLPALKLNFMSRKHKLTASRAFQPKEYLQGDAAHLRRIPPQTPIHIQLDIANPNVEMASYAMKPLFK